MRVLDTLGDLELAERFLVPHLGFLGLLERLRIRVRDIDVARHAPAIEEPALLRIAAAALVERGHVDVAVVGQLVEGAIEDGVQHRPAAQRGVLDALLAHADLVDRRMRLLHRLGDHADVGDLVVLPLERKRLPGPRARQDLQRFLESLPVLVLRHAVAAELGGAVAAPHAHVESALRDDVDERHLLGEPERLVEREDRGGEADTNALGPGRDRARERGRIDREAVVDEMVLGQPHRIEAELFRPHHLLELAVNDLRVRIARMRLEEIIGPELHQATPRYRDLTSSSAARAAGAPV